MTNKYFCHHSYTVSVKAMEKECSPGTPAKDSNIFITIIHEDQRCSFAFDKNRLIIDVRNQTYF
jgi:hypothetical protein